MLRILSSFFFENYLFPWALELACSRTCAGPLDTWTEVPFSKIEFFRDSGGVGACSSFRIAFEDAFA